MSFAVLNQTLPELVTRIASIETVTVGPRSLVIARCFRSPGPGISTSLFTSLPVGLATDGCSLGDFLVIGLQAMEPDSKIARFKIEITSE